MAERVARAERWEDLRPLVRKLPEVEPLMRAYYAKESFHPWTGRSILREQSSVNGTGSFVIFLLEAVPGAPSSVAMVECVGDSCALDWEMSVNYALRQWEEFIAARPAGPSMVRAIAVRANAKDDQLLPAEREDRDKLVAVRFSMAGSDAVLFAVMPAASDLGKWVVKDLPWEHANQPATGRFELGFDTAHAAVPGRVSLVRVVGEGWVR